jgi:hypothetical protein
MKSSSGMLELVILMAFIVAGIPLMVSLMVTANKSKYNYMDDKTVYDVANSVEFRYDAATNSYMPVNLSPIHLDSGGAQVIALLQDDFCPDDGKNISYKLTASHTDGTNAAHATVTPTFNLNITRGWYTKRFNKFSDLHSLVGPATRSLGAGDVYYLVWDKSSDCWMVTHEFVNVIGVE